MMDEAQEEAVAQLGVALCRIHYPIPDDEDYEGVGFDYAVALLQIAGLDLGYQLIPDNEGALHNELLGSTYSHLADNMHFLLDPITRTTAFIARYEEPLRKAMMLYSYPVPSGHNYYDWIVALIAYHGCWVVENEQFLTQAAMERDYPIYAAADLVADVREALQKSGVIP